MLSKEYKCQFTIFISKMYSMHYITREQFRISILGIETISPLTEKKHRRSEMQEYAKPNCRQARQVKSKDSKHIIPYVSTFNPRKTNIYEEIRLTILQPDNHMKDVLKHYTCK